MNAEKYFLSLEKSQIRMSICQQCDNFNSSTQMCTKCWCFMPMKVKLAPACCPEHKWLHETLHTNVI